MSCILASKRFRLDASANKPCLVLNVLGNYDLLTLILLYFTIPEIIKSLILINKNLYKFVINYNKSTNTILKCISYQFGDIFRHSIFSPLLKINKSSGDLISLVYLNLHTGPFFDDIFQLLTMIFIL